ncbi:MAG TPA: hypothetical protein VGV18_01765 [Verrucomicrobiae bacterium]|nr:hypothetical protein [Verrucomicrobiae bacterium]
MRSCLFLCIVPVALAISGCVSHRATSRQSPTAASVLGTNAEPIVTPDMSLTAKVVRYNSVGRFVVLSFPMGRMPQMGQTLSVYRAGMKVGEVKISGPQRDNDIVADLTTGEAQAGDSVHE